MVTAKFGILARDTRMQNRHSLKEVAEGLKKSIVYISDIERGNRNAPTPQMARLWARLIGGDPEEFERVALGERDAIELSVSGKENDALRSGAALALARTWDNLPDDKFAAIMKLLEDEDADE